MYSFSFSPGERGTGIINFKLMETNLKSGFQINIKETLGFNRQKY